MSRFLPFDGCKEAGGSDWVSFSFLFSFDHFLPPYPEIYAIRLMVAGEKKVTHHLHGRRIRAAFGTQFRGFTCSP